MSRLHDDELAIDRTLVRSLVDRAFPQHAGEALRALDDSGSSNALFRLGSDRLVRLPRQPGGGAVIDKEALWLPRVASTVSVAVPAVVGVGEPDLGYPERWAVTTWLDAAPLPPCGSGGRAVGGHRLAQDLARFIRELRAMPLPDRVGGDPALAWYRSGPLEDLDDDFRSAAAACRGCGTGLDIDEALRVWDRAVEASRSIGPAASWLHGDLVAENLLVDDSGGLAAVLDFGGLAVGNPTVDLVVAWETLDVDGRRLLRRALDIDDATWTASRGWALLLAMITFPYYATSMPARCADRRAMAEAALTER